MRPESMTMPRTQEGYLGTAAAATHQTADQITVKITYTTRLDARACLTGCVSDVA
jgi:hypothetical protein